MCQSVVWGLLSHHGLIKLVGKSSSNSSPHSLLEAVVVLMSLPCMLVVSGLVQDEHPLCIDSDDQNEQQSGNGYTPDASTNTLTSIAVPLPGHIIWPMQLP